MSIYCWATKGGSGTTVFASALALASAQAGAVVLVDLAGDLPAALGINEPPSPGINDWICTPTADAASLAALALSVSDSLRVIPRGRTTAERGNPRWADAARALGALPDIVIIDGGAQPPPPPLFEAAEHRLLATQACYLSLRRVSLSDSKPTGVMLFRQPGRVLRPADIERAVLAPVVCELDYDPTVARAVDAGLLAARLPRSLAAAARSVLTMDHR